MKENPLLVAGELVFLSLIVFLLVLGWEPWSVLGLSSGPIGRGVIAVLLLVVTAKLGYDLGRASAR